MFAVHRQRKMQNGKLAFSYLKWHPKCPFFSISSSERNEAHSVALGPSNVSGNEHNPPGLTRIDGD